MTSSRPLRLQFLSQALRRNNGVARRMMLALILFSSVIAALITGVELYLDYRSDLVETLVSNAIKTIFATALLLIIFQAMVGRHLEHIAQYLRRVGSKMPESLDLQLSRPTTGLWRPDALDRVTAAINALRGKISIDQAELVDANQRLKTIIDSSPLAIYTRDREGMVTGWNPAAEKMFGWSAAEVIGKPLPTVPSDRVGETGAFRRRVLSGENIVLAEVTRQRRDGSRIQMNTTLAPLRDAGGRIDGYLAIAADITERKKAEESSRLAASVYEVSSEAMLVTGADNRIIAINPAFTRVTGYGLDEVLGKYSDFLRAYPEDRTFFKDMWQELKITGNWRGEVWGRRKNGEIYPTWITINAVHNDDGSIFRWVAMFSDITKKKESEELIWNQANFDSLTGLPNRRTLHDRLAQELKKAHRAGLPLALLFLDLDRFKEVNDTLGHDSGDILLKDAALRIVSCVRETDTVARFGGDEFTVILGQLEDPGSVDRIAVDILRKLCEPFMLAQERVYVSASIGITLYPEDAGDIETLLKNADQAMYAAKNQGRNRYSYFTPAMQQAAQTRMRLAVDLRGALVDGQFMVYYQPIVELATGSIHKAEALIRWQHPQRGLVSPAEFIPIAEDTGLINDIGDWVFRQAAHQALQWRASRHPEFQISVNKSPIQFQSGSSSPGAWLEHLQALGLPGQSIVVEITEGLLLDAGAAIFDQLLAYRDAGIQVSLDDFGTGYSSLSYLKKFDIDYLKIDQSFVRNLAPASDDMALCEAIIVMAHKLGIKVIAEGVETALQRELLSAAGCDYAQGYLFSRPLPAAQIEAFLTSQVTRGS